MSGIVRIKWPGNVLCGIYRSYTPAWCPVCSHEYILDLYQEYEHWKLVRLCLKSARSFSLSLIPPTHGSLFSVLACSINSCSLCPLPYYSVLLKSIMDPFIFSCPLVVQASEPNGQSTWGENGARLSRKLVCVLFERSNRKNLVWAKMRIHLRRIFQLFLALSAYPCEVFSLLFWPFSTNGA
jgi:hypothetical protein